MSENGGLGVRKYVVGSLSSSLFPVMMMSEREGEEHPSLPLLFITFPETREREREREILKGHLGRQITSEEVAGVRKEVFFLHFLFHF